MGKLKTTIKSIKNAYAPNYLFSTGYCALQTLFHYEEPKAYTCGTYGWNFDLYDIEGVGITTGYRGMQGNYIPHELSEKYENQASKIVYGNEVAWENKRAMLKELQIQFVRELKDTIKK